MLTYLGLLPFIGSAVALHLAPSAFYLLSLKVWSVIIQSFICGSHWGLALSNARTKYILASNLICCIAWLEFLSLNTKYFILMSCCNFLVLLVLDYQMLQEDYIKLTYFKKRFIASTIVISIMLLST